MGIGDQGFSSLLGILEQSRLRCLLVVRFFSLGNKGQGPSLGMGGEGGLFVRYWGTEPFVWNQRSGFCFLLLGARAPWFGIKRE